MKKSFEQLTNDYYDAITKFPPWKKYRHIKSGTDYVLEDFVIECNTNKLMAIYRLADDKFTLSFTRGIDEFAEKFEIIKETTFKVTKSEHEAINDFLTEYRK